MKTVEGQNYRRKATEEHISLVADSGSSYIAQATPKTGKSIDITERINKLGEIKHQFLDILVLGCDGTAVNPGSKGGVLRGLELKAERPMHWFVCLLHANELPLRHLVAKLGGKTSRP